MGMKLSPSDAGGVEVEYATGVVVLFFRSTPVAARLGPRGPILIATDLMDATCRSRASAWTSLQCNLGKVGVTCKILSKMVGLC